MMSQLKPPRSAFLNLPFDRQWCKQHDADLQTRILKNPSNALTAASSPGEIVDPPHGWDSPYNISDFMKSVNKCFTRKTAYPESGQPEQ